MEEVSKNIPAKEADSINKDELLIEFIKYISENDIQDKSLSIKKLEKIYSNNYRHKYSQMLQTLFSMEDETIDYLVSNLDSLSTYINDANCNCVKSYNKLYDHIMLEVARIRAYHDYENRAELVQQQVDNASRQLDEYSQSVYDMDSKIKNFNTQSVSILGIFSAIVVAFFGGLNTIGSILSNMGQHISKYRVVFMAALVGFILFNIIFILLYFIAKILDIDIGTSKWPPNEVTFKYYDLQYELENTSENKDEDELKKIKKQFVQVKKKFNKYSNASLYGPLKVSTRYPIVFYTNAVLIMLMIGTAIGWLINNFTNLKL